MAGYSVGINSETKAFKHGIQSGVIEPLEDAQKELVELGRNRGPEQLERAMKDAQDATERLADETERTARDIEQEFRDTYRKVKRNAEDATDGAGKGFGKLKEGAQEVTQEVGQNLGEAVSSIRGDISDLGQVGQDTLGGLAATIAGTGPAGIAGAAALAAGAVGLGLITAEIEKQNEQVQRLKQYFADAWREAAEGGRDYMDVASQIAEQNDIRFNPDRADEFKQFLEDANTLGLERDTLIQAATGNQTAYNMVIERANQLIDEQNNKPRQDGFLGTAEWDEEMKRLEAVQGKFEDIGEANDDAKAKAVEAAASTSAQLLRLVEQADNAAVSVDELGNKMIELPTGETVYINAETGQATFDLAKFKGDADGVIDHVNGRKAILRVDAALRDAQNAVNRFISTNNGRSFKIHGRFQVDGGGGMIP